MSVILMDAFAQYDGDATQLLKSDAGWAAYPNSGQLVVGGGRTGGDRYQNSGAANDANFDQGLRAALPAAQDEAWVHFAYLTPSYPSAQGVQGLLHAWTVAGADGLVFRAMLSPAGAIEFYNSAGTMVGTTSNGVISPGAQHAICIHFVRHASAGELQLWVDQVEKLHLETLNLGSTDVSLLTFVRNVQFGGFTTITHLMDVFVTNDEGDDNNGFMGDPRLTFLRARKDYDDEQGWTPQRRYMFGAGVLELPATGNRNHALTVADASAMRVGSGDFTIETHVRFAELPEGSNKATLFGKWLESNNTRSWQLFYGGASLNSNRLEVRVSTDGEAGSVTSPISVSWTPIIGRRYHIALQVESGLATLYIDGVRQNAPVAWPTPADNSSFFIIGGQQNNTVPTIVQNSGLVGWMDEIRFTKGIARYGNGFAVPTDAFPRDVSGDSDFSSVVLLMGFDNAIEDESASPRTVVVRNSAARYAPDDGGPSNYVVTTHGDRPDTFVEAPYTAASGILTFTEQPANADTVTVDGTTYTFETVFSDTAGNVLIGATIDDSISNLVAAMNGEDGEGTIYGTSTTSLSTATATNRGADQLVVDADALGSAGNSIAVASSNANNPWSSSTLTGGADIPDPSEFVLERLPPHTVNVLAAQIVHRSRKTDSGPAKVQASFLTADGSSANGEEKAVTTNFLWYTDIVEEDPSTEGALTPSSFVNSRVRVDRTE